MKLDILDPETIRNLARHRQHWNGCTACEIGRLADQHVFARGTLPCTILFIGEAPGKTENAMGEPFIGRCGKLLDGWLSDIKVTYAITNTVLCRPTNRRGGPNRPPNQLELRNCHPRLVSFIVNVARPKLIVNLGSFARMVSPEWDELPTLNIRHPGWVLRQGKRQAEAGQQIKNALEAFVKEHL